MREVQAHQGHVGAGSQLCLLHFRRATQCLRRLFDQYRLIESLKITREPLFIGLILSSRKDSKLFLQLIREALVCDVVAKRLWIVHMQVVTSVRYYGEVVYFFSSHCILEIHKIR